MAEIYIGGPTGGVPEKIFVPNFSDFVKGQSGAELGCTVSQYMVFIKPSEGSFRFIASRNIRHPEMVLFNITSKIGNPPERHPDLYAAELARHSINFFNEQGPEITKLRGKWEGRSSDNYNSYIAYLDEIRNERPITRTDKQNAAFSTWTGGLARSLGFTEIEKIADSSSVSVIFTKPLLGIY